MAAKYLRDVYSPRRTEAVPVLLELIEHATTRMPLYATEGLDR